jgi:hypothetical protein
LAPGSWSRIEKVEFEMTEAMQGPEDSSNFDAGVRPWMDVVFSLADGYVWANWPGTVASIKLGRHEAVTAMMQDFLDQNALGERLAQKADKY